MDENKSSNIQDAISIHDNKLSGTVSAASTSAFFNKKKLSLHHCWSSISIQASSDKPKFTNERAFFIKYLSAKHTDHDFTHLLTKMKKLYDQTPSEIKEEKIRQFRLSNNLSPEFLQNDDLVLQYFIAVWLLHNGYRTEKNKSYIISQVKLQIPLEYIHQAVSFYETFGANHLNWVERKKLMEETCRNGWEYFSFQIINQIKQFSKKSLPTKSL